MTPEQLDYRLIEWILESIPVVVMLIGVMGVATLVSKWHKRRNR